MLTRRHLISPCTRTATCIPPSSSAQRLALKMHDQGIMQSSRTSHCTSALRRQSICTYRSIADSTNQLDPPPGMSASTVLVSHVWGSLKRRLAKPPHRLALFASPNGQTKFAAITMHAYWLNRANCWVFLTALASAALPAGRLTTYDFSSRKGRQAGSAVTQQSADMLR
jgi:hypothetical protein